MDYAYRVFKNMKYFYNTINPATLSGAIDVIVVEQPDGEFKSTPFHVRFGKYGVFSHSDKYVDIQINGEEIDLKMKLGDSGVAFFVEESDSNQIPSYMLTSPPPEPGFSPAQSTDQVLSQSARILGENSARTESDRKLTATGDSNPEGVKRKDVHEQEQSLLEVQQRKRNMPFNSSVFSIRKNRSLPDLQSIANHNNGYHSDVEGKPVEISSGRISTRPLRHSKSQAFEKSVRSEKPFESVSVSTKAPRRKKSRVSFEPVSIKIEGESSDSEASSISSSPTRSHLDACDVDRIAEGALSDSEVDRHRNSPEIHASDVTDWKWGEIPETRENKIKLDQGKDKNITKPKGETSSWTWFPWGHRSSPAQAPPAEEGISLDELFSTDATPDPSKMEKYLGKTNSTAVSIDSGNASRGTSQPSSPTGRSDDAHFSEKTPTLESNSLVDNAENQRTRNASDQRSADSNEDIFPLSEDELDDVHPTAKSRPSYVLSLRLNSEKLRSLGLVYGANECRFSITTKFQGTSWCSCNIYLYKWYERIVISDIDGTITKSDVLGHVIPAIGGTWAHAGVAELYTRIKNNGYKMVYLSSRAIGQSHTTKQYLKSIAQDSKQLPDGPVLLSPTSVLVAFRREVIERRPEEFKIAALTDLKNLFPVKQPFFAGFGNRETDVTSYRAVGIMTARILIIDPSGSVRRSDSIGYVSSYLTMATETVDYLFPPLMKSSKKESDLRMEPLQPTWTNPLEHSSFTHWKPEKAGSPSDAELAAYESDRKKASDKAKKK